MSSQADHAPVKPRTLRQLPAAPNATVGVNSSFQWFQVSPRQPLIIAIRRWSGFWTGKGKVPVPPLSTKGPPWPLGWGSKRGGNQFFIPGFPSSAEIDTGKGPVALGIQNFHSVSVGNFCLSFHWFVFLILVISPTEHGFWRHQEHGRKRRR